MLPLLAVLSLFLVQLTSVMRPLQCKSPFFECVAPFLDSNWNFMMSTELNYGQVNL